MNNPQVLITSSGKDYELIDSGDGEKLERFGAYTLRRPDPQALWRKRLPEEKWAHNDGYFTREERRGEWVLPSHVPKRWNAEFGGLKLWIKPTAFKHTGLFPEQAPNWDWTAEIIADAKKREPAAPIEILNLFGYTGAATLACARAGASVVHVDGSKSAITWAKENAESSGLAAAPVRWILDDAQVFVEREIKRGRKYQGIIMDPPAFGHGPKKELWKIEEHLVSFIERAKQILADKPLFFLVNGYSAGYSAIAYENNLLSLKEQHGGRIEIGELTIAESGTAPRLLPCGIFARWSA